jgi:hypothetical protein
MVKNTKKGTKNKNDKKNIYSLETDVVISYSK